MKANKNDKLKSLIQQSGLDQPMPDFTAMVMQDISSTHSPEELINPALKSLLQEHGMERLPSDFTETVMMEIEELQKELIFKPIISLKAGFIIILTVIALFILAPSGSEAVSGRSYPGIQLLQQGLKHIEIDSTTSIYFSVLIMISVLLSSDYLIGNYRSGRKLL